jgi:hypothetical protein
MLKIFIKEFWSGMKYSWEARNEELHEVVP